MFVDQAHNLEASTRFWEGKPSRGLLWGGGLEWVGMEEEARKAGYEDPFDYAVRYAQDEFGYCFWARIVQPAETVNPFVEVKKAPMAAGEVVEHRSAAGTLREIRQDGQIVKQKVETVDDLRILVEMWRHLEVRRVARPHPGCPAALVDRMLKVVAPSHQSAVQRMLQYDTGVDNFWYLVQDAPALMEEALALWQDMLEQQYRILEAEQVPRFYQAENTSTTMISPEYYEKYSLSHLRQFSASARRCGARTLVHMCGLLRDLLPLFVRTGMNGINSFTPPPVGNTEFRLAFETLPPDFMVQGRWNAPRWIGQSRAQILSALRQELPDGLVRDRPFYLGVGDDGVPYTRADLARVRDAIAEFDRDGG